jgi:hypothetical protein
LKSLKRVTSCTAQFLVGDWEKKISRKVLGAGYLIVKIQVEG